MDGVSEKVAAEAPVETLAEDDPVQLYDRAPVGYLSTSPDGHVVEANATFLAWTGYDASALSGRPLSDLFPAGGRIYLETHVMPLLMMQGSVREIAVDVVRTDGSRLPVLLNARLDRDRSGQPRAVRIAVFDATERREYERELLRAKERAEASEARAHALARTLQQTLIPPLPPTIPHLDIGTQYRPAGDGTEVGGDFYDLFQVGDGEWVVTLGDVCGKGVEAAVVTALVRHTIRALAVSTDRPHEILRQLDEVLHRSEYDRFCTVVLVRLVRGPDGWTATIGTGGHPPPVLLRRGLRAELVEVRGSLVGVLPAPHFTDAEIALAPGDGLLLYTDGVTEARGDDDFFGESRLLEATTRHGGPAGPRGAASFVDGLVDEVVGFQSGCPRDDIAVVALAVPPEPAGPKAAPSRPHE